MKALSGYAEWFWLMAKNYKDVENRPRPLPYEISMNMPYRIYLHGSKTHASNQEINFIKEHLTNEQLIEFMGVDWSKYRGRIMGEITIYRQIKKHQYIESDHVDVGSQQREFEILTANNDISVSKWFFGLYGYAVKDGVLYENTIPYRGQLGFFDVVLNNLSNKGE
jgi:hypothetical protein